MGDPESKKVHTDEELIEIGLGILGSRGIHAKPLTELSEDELTAHLKHKGALAVAVVDELAEHPDEDQLKEHLEESARRIRRASTRIGENPDEELIEIGLGILGSRGIHAKPLTELSEDELTAHLKHKGALAVAVVDELAEHPDADQLEEHLGESGRRIRRASERIHESPDEELQ